jgi:L-threonylcarbamoyladenylate synthase
MIEGHIMHRAEVLPTHTPGLFAKAVQQAAARLRAGEVVALPTETVYGLAANALDALAVSRIYKAKGRPTHNPIIVHVASSGMARQCVSDWPAIAEKLARAFWPGPLTLVLPRSAAVPDIVAAGGPTVGVRWPAHPFIQAVIAACGFPLAAPSANLSNHLSATDANHVQAQLGDRIPLIVDGGQCQVGIESTVVDVTAGPPRLLRPGMIHEEALIAVTGALTLGFGDSEEILRSPGLLKKHYSPRARLVMLNWADDDELRRQLAIRCLPPHRTHVVAHACVPADAGLYGVSVIPHDPEAFGRALYAELHRCDAANPEVIVVEGVPGTPAWRAIADRLRRAAME